MRCVFEGDKITLQVSIKYKTDESTNLPLYDLQLDFDTADRVVRAEARSNAAGQEYVTMFISV